MSFIVSAAFAASFVFMDSNNIDYDLVAPQVVPLSTSVWVEEKVGISVLPKEVEEEEFIGFAPGSREEAEAFWLDDSLKDLYLGKRFESFPSSIRNGKVDDDYLCKVPYSLNHDVSCAALSSWVALNEAFKAEFGSDVIINSSYRTYESQVSLKAAKGHFAAPPGYSNHGWGLALDIQTPKGSISFSDPYYKWLYENAPSFGWENPEWALPGNGKEEPWHWEFIEKDSIIH